MRPRSTKKKPLTPQEKRAGAIMLLLALLPPVAIFIATETVSENALARFMAAFAAIAFLAMAGYKLRAGYLDSRDETLGARVLAMTPGALILIASSLFAIRFYWLGTQSLVQP